MRLTGKGVLALSAVATAAALLLSDTGQAAAAETETPDVFPAGKGRDEAFYLCTACHGSALVRAQGLTRPRWDELLSWMTERHGMPDVQGEERELILDYLAAAFPPRQSPRGGLRPNPFVK
jgi:hypothetical protein